MWLVVEDAYSKWPEVIRLRTATSSTVAAALMKIFAIQGLPEQLISDNGSQFTLEEFKEFSSLEQLIFATLHHITLKLMVRLKDSFKLSRSV